MQTIPITNKELMLNRAVFVKAVLAGKEKTHPPHRGTFRITLNDQHEGLGHHHSPPFCPVNASISHSKCGGRNRAGSCARSNFLLLSTRLCTCKEGPTCRGIVDTAASLRRHPSQPSRVQLARCFARSSLQAGPQAGLADD